MLMYSNSNNQMNFKDFEKQLAFLKCRKIKKYWLHLRLKDLNA